METALDIEATTNNVRAESSWQYGQDDATTFHVFNYIPSRRVSDIFNQTFL